VKLCPPVRYVSKAHPYVKRFPGQRRTDQLDHLSKADVRVTWLFPFLVLWIFCWQRVTWCDAKHRDLSLQQFRSKQDPGCCCFGSTLCEQSRTVITSEQLPAGLFFFWFCLPPCLVSTVSWPIWRGSLWRRWLLPRRPPVAVSLLTGGEAAKHLTTLFRSPSVFAASARFATEGSEPEECFGLIGKDGRRFCLVKGCDKKHRGGAFNIPPNHLFIKHSSTEAFCSPCVDAAKVPTGQVAELLAVSKPVSEWVDVFGVLGSAEEELPLDEVERRLQFLSVARAHKTPRKAEPSSPFVFGGDDLDLMLEPVPEEILKGSEFEWSKALPDDLVSALEVFGRTVSSLASTVPIARLDL
jgi:hypothetical protein